MKMMLNDQPVKIDSKDIESTIISDSSMGESIQRIQFVDVDEDSSIDEITETNNKEE